MQASADLSRRESLVDFFLAVSILVGWVVGRQSIGCVCVCVSVPRLDLVVVDQPSRLRMTEKGGQEGDFFLQQFVQTYASQWSGKLFEIL